MKLGAARAKAPAAWRLLDITVDPHTSRLRLHAQPQETAPGAPARRPLSVAHQPVRARSRRAVAVLHMQLVEVEAAFKNLKDDLELRPVYHQLEQRIEAHIFVAFLAYCLHVTLRARLRPLAPASPRGRCSTSSPPSRRSTSTSPPPTAEL